ncbi:multidrug effflux MFS transporter [Tardiphaga sp.]|uniref:multidrug effflux MFS transporter n=1 Tax=Tardiphaga sp. TaxID=1926292 RepID=UPI0037DA5E17
MTDINADAPAASPAHLPMRFAEFVAMIAAIMALNPLAMDIMLPALPHLGAAFKIADGNHLQAVLSVFLLGFGFAQFAIGPLSDRYGRRPILLAGMGVYCIASVLALFAPSFEMLLLARLLQGLGTAATRVIAVSIVRDCYSGGRMAGVMSLAIMVFISVPVIAPSFGQALMVLTEWRGIFVVLMLYGLLTFAWSAWRLPETLSVANRRSLAIPDVLFAYRQTISHRQTLGYGVAAGVLQGALFAFVFTSQQVFTEIFHLGHYFPLAFASIAFGVAIAGFFNSRVVNRLGMRFISHAALFGFVTVGSLMLLGVLAGFMPLWLFMALSMIMMFAFGLMFSNFTALAMEPQGHIAGTASSLYGTLTTLLGIAIGAFIGQHYDGTLLPFTTGLFACTLIALAVVLVAEKGRLFMSHKAVS